VSKKLVPAAAYTAPFRVVCMAPNFNEFDGITGWTAFPVKGSGSFETVEGASWFARMNAGYNDYDQPYLEVRDASGKPAWLEFAPEPSACERGECALCNDPNGICF
jgi:hypothetical protein